MVAQTSPGRPIRSTWPRHDEDEIDAAVAVLRSGRVNARVHGEQCTAFEEEFAEFCGMPHAIAVANGTLALELALRGLGIGAGDEVIVPARSFFATASCVKAVGAEPVFADIEPHSHNIDPESVERMVSEATRAVIAVHLGGLPCDMDRLAAVCRRFGLLLIEDCAQAHGAEYRGRKAGSLGDAAAFSFCTDKIMTTGGEGGMLLLRDEKHWSRAWAYKDHGKNPEKVLNAKPGNEFRYVHDSFGNNFRLTELQAAIGRVQLAKLPEWLLARRRNAAILDEHLRGHPAVEILPATNEILHAYYKYYFMIRPEHEQGLGEIGMLIGALRDAGIPAATGSCPDMSLEEAFLRHPPRRDGDLAAAHDVGRRSIMLPVDPTLDEADMTRMALAVRDVLASFGASKEMARA
jgi:dTDP-4-amino-4,6-dideoxygalactose transaminase